MSDKASQRTNYKYLTPEEIQEVSNIDLCQLKIEKLQEEIIELRDEISRKNVPSTKKKMLQENLVVLEGKREEYIKYSNFFTQQTTSRDIQQYEPVIFNELEESDIQEKKLRQLQNKIDVWAKLFLLIKEIISYALIIVTLIIGFYLIFQERGEGYILIGLSFGCIFLTYGNEVDISIFDLFQIKAKNKNNKKK